MAAFEFLGPYRIRQEIGRGGMGTVYEATHEKTGQRVAVKLISSTVADDVKFRRRFAAEVETLKRLRHPGIVQLIGYGEEDGHLFYVMELVEGESLQQRIRRERRLQWLPALEIAIQVATALKHAHDIGVIHRDLKPANLLITTDGTVKLVDFGIAKIFGSVEQTVAGSVLGTADYMAPEQADSRSITPRTDLYALGSVMYAMFAGRPPFSGKRLTEVIDSLKRERPVPLDLINPDLPEEIVSLIDDLLEKDPGDRPPTALAVLNRLKAIRVGLQRQQTLSADTSQTVGGDQPPEAGLTSGGRRAGTGVLGDDATSASGPHTHPTDPSTDSSSPPESPLPPVPPGSPDDVTVVSQGAPDRGDVGEEDFELRKPTRSHFQSVDTSGGRVSVFDSQPQHEPFGWWQALSVAGLVLFLIAGLAVIVYAFRTPSADQLHSEIRAAEAADDLRDAEPLIRQFLETYPDDPRAGDLEALEDLVAMDQFLSRLRGKAHRPGGAEGLAAAEQTFLEAMELRQRAPGRAEQQLRAWLAVHAPPGATLAPTIRRMASIARREISELRSKASAGKNDPRVEALVDRIAWGRANLSKPQLRDLLSGIRQLYGSKQWAAPAVAHAESELAALEAAEDQP